MIVGRWKLLPVALLVAMVALPPCEMAANIEAELTHYWLD